MKRVSPIIQYSMEWTSWELEKHVVFVNVVALLAVLRFEKIVILMYSSSKMYNSLSFLILTGVCLAIDTIKPTFEETAQSHNKVVVCYWGTWSNYRPSLGKFTPSDIDASLCTHLVYSFAGIDPNTSMIKSLDEWMDMVINYFLIRK